MPRLSTFSIVACDLDESAWGVAVSSKFPAVGAVVPWAEVGAGAIATQAFANPAYGPKGLSLLKEGFSAQDALDSLLRDDPDRETRQVGIVDSEGRAVSYTGKECLPWAGGIAGTHYAIQGNLLVGAEVVRAMEDAFLHTEGDLPARLYAALLAGEKAGGDRRGKQSAAIYVVKPKGGYGGLSDRWIDYRVDDALHPVPRLGELLNLHRLHFERSPEEERITLEGKSLERLQRIMRKLGYYLPDINGLYDDATRAALQAFLGNENFEERADFERGTIDSPVLAYLLEKFS